MRKLLVLLLGPLLMGSAYEQLASSWSEKDNTYSILLINRLDDKTVDDMVELIRKSKKKIIALELASWGGDGDAGIRLAEFVSRWPKKVVVLDSCNSACSFAALVALGQGKLVVGTNGKVGVHQAKDNDTHQADVQWTKMVARILHKYGAPQAPLKVMVATPPDTMTFFDQDQLVAWGATPLDRSWLGYFWRWYEGKTDEQTNW